jgi:hypothetical protein
MVIKAVPLTAIVPTALDIAILVRDVVLVTLIQAVTFAIMSLSHVLPNAFLRLDIIAPHSLMPQLHAQQTNTVQEMENLPAIHSVRLVNLNQQLAPPRPTGYAQIV